MSTKETITPAEARQKYPVGDPMLVCDSVADLLEAHPWQHQQQDWVKETECGTVACIAGWVGELHRDFFFTAFTQALGMCDSEPIDNWIHRQAARLGLELNAAKDFFNMMSEQMSVFMLREMSKFHANSDGEKISGEDLLNIRLEAVKRNLMGIGKES